MPLMARSLRKGLISKGFNEKIMLAVIQVNGCRYCSWFHTRLAMKEGISKMEIYTLPGGEFDGLMCRLKGKRMKGSQLVNELGIVFGSLLMFPVALLHGLFYGNEVQQLKTIFNFCINH